MTTTPLSNNHPFSIMTSHHKALLLVDIQNDFLPGGSLPIKDGQRIIPCVNQLLEMNFDLIIATKDWHPQDHLSFASNHPNKKPGDSVLLEQESQILWPSHCIQNTSGAEFAPGWDTTKVHKTFYKGTNRLFDSYSAFYDNRHITATGLGEYLKQKGIKDLYIAGLATDYCVKYSVLDAIHLGFNTYVVIDACRGVELHKGDCQKAERNMAQQGAHIVYTKNLSEPC